MKQALLHYFFRILHDSFRNTGPSLLQCTGCHERILVDFPHCLSAAARQSLTRRYEDLLVQLHRDSCPFRRDAQNYMHQQIKDNDSSDFGIPAMFTQVWRPEEVLELVDPLRPCGIVRKRWQVAIDCVRSHPHAASMDYKSWKLPPVDEKLFHNYDLSQGGDSLLEKLIAFIDDEEENTGEGVPTVSHEMKRGALLIVLLGWTVDTSSPGSFHCSICHSKLNVIPVSSASSTDSEPSSKRLCQRSSLNAPVDCHRYYCPFVRGLPHDASHRLTDIIIVRMLNQQQQKISETTESVTAATDLRLEIRKLLRDVISPSRATMAS